MNSTPNPRRPLWLGSLMFLLALNFLAIPACAKQYALLVGVRAYPRASESLTPLPFAERDAQDLAPILEKLGYQVTLMTHANAEGEGKERFAPHAALIRKELAGLVDRPFLKESDTILVVLSGHGIQLESETDKTKSAFYFCPADADITDLTHLEKVTEAHHLIPIQELYDTINKCGAGLKLLVVDACRNDPNQGGFRDAKTVTRPPLPPPPGGMLAIFSCSAGERAREDQKLGHGVFGHFFIKGLSGEGDLDKDGVLKLLELHEYTTSNTYDYTLQTWSTKQTPELTGSVRGSIVIASIPKPEPTPEPVPPIKPMPNPGPMPPARTIPTLPSRTPTSPLPERPIPAPAPEKDVATDWKISWNHSQEEFEQEAKEYQASDYRLDDLEVYSQRGHTLFAAIYRNNKGGRGWWAAWQKSGQEFDQDFERYRRDHRMTDIEVHVELLDGKPRIRYSGIWVANRENLDWIGRWNMTEAQWQTEFDTNNQDGYRPVDIDVYFVDGKANLAAVWVANPDRRGWELWYNQSQEAFQKKVDSLSEKGYRLIALESCVEAGRFYYTGIFEENLTNDRWETRWNLTQDEYQQFSGEFSAQGLTPIDFYSYSHDGETYYGGVWSASASEKQPSVRPNTPVQPAKPANRPSTDIPSGGGSG